MDPTAQQSVRDSNERYGSLSRIFHWGMALLIGWQGLKFLDRIDDGEHWIGQTLVPWHVSVGTLLLVLVVLRIAWAASQNGNRPPAPYPATAMLVRAGHYLLYAGMALLPITGILALLGGGHGWTVFGIEFAAKGEKTPWMATLGGLHSPIAWMLFVMIAGHIGMALLHGLIRKDGVLQRMA